MRTPLSLRFSPSEVTLSGFAGGEYLPLPASKGLAFPFLLTLDGYPTSAGICAQEQWCSAKTPETREIVEFLQFLKFVGFSQFLGFVWFIAVLIVGIVSLVHWFNWVSGEILEITLMFAAFLGNISVAPGRRGKEIIC